MNISFFSKTKYFAHLLYYFIKLAYERTYAQKIKKQFIVYLLLY